MSIDQDSHVVPGLATLGHGQTRALRALEAIFVDWADSVAAEEITAPMLLPVDDARKLGIFGSFPHVALAACPLNAGRVAAEPDRYLAGVLPTTDVLDSRYILPSSACYGLYLHLAGQTLPAARRFTLVGQCFRNESEYSGLRRLLSFRQREIVYVGNGREALAHLEWVTPLVLRLADWLGLAMTVETAEDPFFDQSSGRALVQHTLPVKREFLVDGLAIASINFHREFFGTRFGITLSANGRPAQTSCVGFGLERWLAVLDQAFDSDWDAVLRRLVAFCSAGEGRRI